MTMYLVVHYNCEFALYVIVVVLVVIVSMLPFECITTEKFAFSSPSSVACALFVV